MADEIKTADEARELPDGTWVTDVDEHPWCILDTHMGFPQRMAGYKRLLTNLDNLAYPLSLAAFQGDCDHRWGTHEMGQCIRCGVRVSEPRPRYFQGPPFGMFQEVGPVSADSSKEAPDAE